MAICRVMIFLAFLGVAVCFAAGFTPLEKYKDNVGVFKKNTRLGWGGAAESADDQIRSENLYHMPMAWIGPGMSVNAAWPFAMGRMQRRSKEKKDNSVTDDVKPPHDNNDDDDNDDDDDDDTPFKVPLDVDSKITLFWGLDYKARKVNIKISFSKDLPDFDWFAVGWSDYGELVTADFCLLWFSWDGAAYLQDTFTDDEGNLHKDQHNDCLESKWNKNEKTLTFSRIFDTCDDEDYVIEDGTTHVVWARGVGSQSSAAQPAQAAPVDRGMVRVELLKSTCAPPQLPPSARALSVLTSDVHVPATDTTYWCHVREMPDWLQATRHHIIRYESQITPGNEGLVHHMEVFYCDAPADEVISSYKGSCFAPDRPEDTKVCTKVRAAWAMGAGPFVYPEEAGLPIGGPESNNYIMLEVHYNNPEVRPDWVDSSGILIYMTPVLREHDAAIMELGLEYTDKMAIPEGQTLFPLSGYCTADCTNIGLASRTIYVFGSQLHTHLTGNRVVTYHFRDGKELPNLNRDNHYSTHFQEIRLLKRQVEVRPGDVLVTTCDFNTMGRSNMTFGGHAITDEMCLNYIHYYPATELEVCKSSVATNSLNNYFTYLKDWENLPIQPQDSVREKFGRVEEWYPARVNLLRALYEESPISMQCNSSDGSRFPGEWDDNSRDVVLELLPEEPRVCPDNK